MKTILAIAVILASSVALVNAAPAKYQKLGMGAAPAAEQQEAGQPVTRHHFGKHTTGASKASKVEKQEATKDAKGEAAVSADNAGERRHHFGKHTGGDPSAAPAARPSASPDTSPARPRAKD